MQVSRYGFGAAPIGNLFSAVDDDTARASVDAAYEAGFRLFDTAPHYGLGLSERRLGAALAGRPRDSYTLSTKVGRLLVPSPDGGRDDQGFDVPADVRRVWDFSRDGVRRSLEESLERLGLDAVDIVLIHDPDDHWEQAVSEAYPALAELRDQGVVKAVGVGMNQAGMLAAFVRETEVDLVMLAGRYTLLDQSGAEELLPLCEERGVSVLAAGAFNSGLLATHDPAGTFDYAPGLRVPPRQGPPHRLRLRATRRHPAPGGAGLPPAPPGDRLGRRRRPFRRRGHRQRGPGGRARPRGTLGRPGRGGTDPGLNGRTRPFAANGRARSRTGGSDLEWPSLFTNGRAARERPGPLAP